VLWVASYELAAAINFSLLIHVTHKFKNQNKHGIFIDLQSVENSRLQYFLLFFWLRQKSPNCAFVARQRRSETKCVTSVIKERVSAMLKPFP
jgi:hypothetical protein